jgi:hypothetical protein
MGENISVYGDFEGIRKKVQKAVSRLKRETKTNADVGNGCEKILIIE